MIHTRAQTQTHARTHSSEWESSLGIWTWTLQIAGGVALHMYRMLQAERSASLDQFTDILKEAGLWRAELANWEHRRAHWTAHMARPAVAP